jgi:hypothetical protein
MNNEKEVCFSCGGPGPLKHLFAPDVDEPICDQCNDIFESLKKPKTVASA